MKYSFMTFSCPELTLDEILAYAKKVGYDGVEIRSECEHKHNVELASSASERREIRQKAEDSGISLCAVATSCMYADPAKSEGHIKLTREFIDLASDIGSERIRVFGGPIPEGTTREEATTLLVNALSSFADHAAERGVTVCIETHDDWSDPKFFAEVMKQVDHPAIAVNWDIMHPVRYTGCSMQHAYDLLKPWIKHVHIHDGVFGEEYAVKMVPIGEGKVDHKTAIEILKDASYEGFISGEWINWEPYDVHLLARLKHLRAYEFESGK